MGNGSICFVTFLLIVAVHTVAIIGAPQRSGNEAAIVSSGQVGKPQSNESGNGSVIIGQELVAANANGRTGPVWQSGNHAISIGPVYGPSQAGPWKPKPYSAQVGYTFTFGRR